MRSDRLLHVLCPADELQSAATVTNSAGAPSDRTAILHYYRLREVRADDLTYFYEVCIWQQPWQTEPYVVTLYRLLRPDDLPSRRSQSPIQAVNVRKATLKEARDTAKEVLKSPFSYDSNSDVVRDQYMGRVREHGKYDRPWGIDDGLLAETAILGAQLPTGPAGGEVARQLWGRTEGEARTTLLNFVRNAPLVYGTWAHWKWLYKQAEAAVDVELLAIMCSRLDTLVLQRPTGEVKLQGLLQTPPSASTVNYLKRRASRYLRGLAKRDPDRYAALGIDILESTGSDKRSLDAAHQWVTFDIMYGNSRRYVQTGHGTTRYVCRSRMPSIMRQHEIAPDGWTSHAQRLARLLTSDTAIEVAEWACLLLLRRRLPLPGLSDAVLDRFFASGSPILVRTAARAISQRLRENAQVPPQFLIRSFQLGSGTVRAQIMLALQTNQKALSPPLIREEFLRLWNSAREQPRTTPRHLDLAAFLTRFFYDALSQESLRQLASDVLKSRWRDLAPRAIGTMAQDPRVSITRLLQALPSLDEEYRQLVRPAIDRIDPGDIPEILEEFSSRPSDMREFLRVELLAQRQTRTFDAPTARKLILTSNKWVRTVGLELLRSRNALRDDATIELVRDLLRILTPPSLASLLEETEVFGFIMAFSSARQHLVSGLCGSPETVSLLSAPVARDLLGSATGKDLATLLMNAKQDNWARMQTLLLGLLTHESRHEAFWKAIWVESSTQKIHTALKRVVPDLGFSSSFDSVDGVQMPHVLRTCSGLPTDLRKLAEDALLASRRTRLYDALTARDLLTIDDSWVQRVSLKLLHIPGAVAEVDIENLVLGLLETLSPAGLVLLLQVPEATDLLLLTSSSSEFLANGVARRPEVVTALSESVARTVLNAVSGSNLAYLILHTGNWNTIPPVLRDLLSDKTRSKEFWAALWAGASDSESTGVLSHVVKDSDLVANYVKSGEGHLPRQIPAILLPLVLAWLRDSPELWDIESESLRRAAVHEEPMIRSFALRRISAIGPTPRVALALMESGLPECTALAHTYLDELPRHPERNLEVSIVLCDSPIPAVRQYGQVWTHNRLDVLPLPDLVSRLSEHDNPAIQAFVAQLFQTRSELVGVAPHFDRSVLRPLNRGRRAKESVKHRISTGPVAESQVDAGMLLDLARGRTRRDAEWALGELARRALAGDSVEEIGVEGTGGI